MVTCTVGVGGEEGEMYDTLYHVRNPRGRCRYSLRGLGHALDQKLIVDRKQESNAFGNICLSVCLSSPD